jgi:hypothetical protein
MTVQSLRRKGLLAAVLIATGFLTSIASPAMAAPPDQKQAASACWVDGETGITRCFASDEAMVASISTVVGSVPADLAQSVGLTQSRSSAVALSSAVLARLYSATSYGGDVLTVIGPSDDWCDANSITVDDIGSTWDNRVSSVRVYFGCSVRLYASINLGGDSAAFGTTPTVGAMDNRTSSYRVY